MVVEEFYSWKLVAEPKAGVLRFHILLRFKDDCLYYIEMNTVVEKQNMPVKVAFLQAQGDEPSEYIDLVLDVLVQLLSRFEVSEEHYEQHIYL